MDFYQVKEVCAHHGFHTEMQLSGAHLRVGIYTAYPLKWVTIGLLSRAAAKQYTKESLIAKLTECKLRKILSASEVEWPYIL